MKKILLFILIILLIILGYRYNTSFGLLERSRIQPFTVDTFLHLEPRASLKQRAEAFFNLEEKTPVSIVYEWIPYYYRHPDPEHIVEVFNSIVARGKIIDEPGKSKAKFPVALTLRYIFEEDMGRIKRFIPDTLEKKLLPEQEITLETAQSETLVHFFGTLLHNNPEQIFKLMAEAGNYPEGWTKLAEKIIRKAKNYSPAQLKYFSDVDLVWAEFMATGDEKKIDLLLEVLKEPETLKNKHLLKAVGTSLYAYARLYVDVHARLSEADENASGILTPRLEALNTAIKEYAVMPGSMYLRRGVNFTNIGKQSSARRELYKALAYYPDYPDAYVNLANAYEYQDERRKAFHAGNKAYQIDPQDPSVCYGLGRHYYIQRKYDDALKMYLEAKKLAPQEDIYLVAIADIYKHKRDTENAVKYYRQYLQASPHGYNADKIKRYLASVNASLEADPNDLITLLKNKEFGRLEEILGNHLKENEKNNDGVSLLYEAYNYLCYYSDMNYNMDEWRDYFIAWQQERPDSHFANAAIGIFYINYAWYVRGSGWSNTVPEEGWELYKERMLKAREYLEKAYTLNPSDPFVPASLITVSMSLGLGPEEMEKQFQRSVQADPTEFEGYYRKLTYLMPKWRGSKEKMFSFARESADNAPEGSLIPLLVAKAHWERYYRSEDRENYFEKTQIWEELKTVYTQLYNTFPESSEILNWFARTAYLADDFATAKNLFSQIEDDWNESVWGNHEYFSKVKKEVFEIKKER